MKQKVTINCGVLFNLQNPGNSKSNFLFLNSYSSIETIVKIQVCHFVNQQLQNSHASMLWSLWIFMSHKNWWNSCHVIMYLALVFILLRQNAHSWPLFGNWEWNYHISPKSWLITLFFFFLKMISKVFFIGLSLSLFLSLSIPIKPLFKYFNEFYQ